MCVCACVEEAHAWRRLAYPSHQRWWHPSSLKVCPVLETAQQSDMPAPYYRKREHYNMVIVLNVMKKQSTVLFCTMIQYVDVLGSAFWHSSIVTPTWQLFTNLVGVRTRQKMPYGSSDNFCSTGRTNAAVFPLPVLAQPIQSRPGYKPRQTTRSSINLMCRPTAQVGKYQLQTTTYWNAYSCFQNVVFLTYLLK